MMRKRPVTSVVVYAATYGKALFSDYYKSGHNQCSPLSFKGPTAFITSNHQREFRRSRFSSQTDVHNSNNIDRDAMTYQIDHGIMYRFRGVVETGYGRGGKKLGFPTANLGPATFFDHALTNISTGVYFGYAMIEQSFHENENISTGATSSMYKAVVNIGYSPTFVGNENKLKIIEAHLLLPERQLSTPMLDFYNATIRLQLIGYIRPEMKFSSFPDLIQQITNDIDTAKQLFIKDPFVNSECSQDAFFVINEQQPWIGTNGGNSTASYEIVPLQVTSM